MRNDGREPDRETTGGHGGRLDRESKEDGGPGSEFVGSEYLGSSNQDTGGMEGSESDDANEKTGAVSEKGSNKPKKRPAKTK